MKSGINLHARKSVSSFQIFYLIGAIALFTASGQGLYAAQDIVQDIQVNEAILVSQPNTSEAMNAQKELVGLYLKQGRTVEAKAAAAALVGGYAELAGRAGAIQQAGEAFRYAGEHEAMLQMHEYVVSQWPGSNEAMWSKRTVVLAQLLMGQPEQAETVFNQLVTDYAQTEALPEAVYWLGRDCLYEVKDYDRALAYYGYVIDHWPAHAYFLKAYTGQTLVYLNQNQPEQVQEYLDTIRTEYVGHRDAPAMVNKIAAEYEMSKNYSQARDVYQLMVDVWGGEKTEAVLKATQQVGVLSVKLKDYEASDAVAAKLQEDYRGQLGLVAALRAIAYAWQEAGERERSLVLNEYVVKQWPGSEDAMRSQRDVVSMKIQSGQPDAEQAIQAFLTEYAEQKNMAEAVYWLGADSQYKCKDDTRAAMFYGYVVSHWPESSWTLKAEISLQILQLDFEGELVASVQQLIAAYPDQPVLVDLLTRKLSRCYHRSQEQNQQGQEEQAMEGYESVLNGCQEILRAFPSITPSTLRVSMMAGESCRQLGQEEQAIGFYRVVAQHPENSGQDVAPALFLIGNLYRELQEKEEVDKTQAEQETRQAYETILKKYPSSVLVGAAKTWLERHDLTP